MIIGDQKSSIVEVYGENTSKKATINGEKLKKLQYILTQGLYSDPMAAVIVEIVNNGMDAVIESGKNPINHPVMVEFIRETVGYKMTVRDEGVGMDGDFFENVFMSMLSSTKEDSDDVIGHFGIGGKSWASLGKQVKFTIVKNSKKKMYLCYKGEEFIDYDLIMSEDTTDGNGVTFEMPLTYSDYLTAITKAKQKLAYYDTVALVIEGKLWDNKIYRNEIFQWSNNSPFNDMHLCLKDVVYSIDWVKLGVPAINVPIALRFGLKDGIIPTPSRENIQMNRETIEAIKNKIGEVTEWMAERYNKDVMEVENIIDVWPQLNINNITLELEDRKFTLNDLSRYTKVGFKEPSVKNVSLRLPGWYKTHYNNFNIFFQLTARWYWGTWQTKKLNYYQDVVYQLTGRNMNCKVVVVDDFAVGNVKEYIKSVYGKQSTDYLFIKMKGQPPLEWWRLNVLFGTKDNIKARMLEFREVLKQFTDKCIDLRGVSSSPEYLKWLKEKQDKQKEDRKNGVFKGNSLNKKQGDITIGWARKAYHGGDVVFEKKAEKIESLGRVPALIVYSTEKADRIVQLAEAFINVNNLKMCLIGKLEAKKLPKLDKIIKFEEFMSKKGGRLFGRMCSAMIYKKELEVFNSTVKHHNTLEYIKELFPSYNDAAKKLGVYIDKNNVYVDEEVAKEMMDVAEEYKLWDNQLKDKYLLIKEFNKKYGFLTLLGYYKYDSTQGQSYKRIINQLLLFRKKYYNDFEQYELMVPKKIEAPVLEETIIELA